MSIRRGNNIKALREYYGETQSELGEAIGVSRNTVQNWEEGLEIKPENRQQIACHFRVTEDQLENSDFSKLKKGDGIVKITYKQIASNIKILFPVYLPETDNIDIRFIEANKKHKEMREKIIELGQHAIKNEISDFEAEKEADSFFKLYDEAFDTYIDLVSESNDVYSSANLLSLLCLIGYFLTQHDMLEQYEKLKNDGSFKYLENNKKATKKMYLRNGLGEKTSKTGYIYSDIEYEDMSLFYDLLLTILKSTQGWEEKAEYFIACRWIFNLCNNDNSKDSNHSFGIELLHLYSQLGNKYIRRKLAELHKLFEE